MRWLVVVTVTLVTALMTIVGILLATAGQGFAVRVEVVRALANLVTAVTVTGLLSFVFAWKIAERTRADERAHQREHDERAREHERERVILAALNELKAGHEKAYLAQLLLQAHTTGHTFAEQLPRIMEARARLQRVQRERFVGSTANLAVQDMLDFLREVAEEYRSHYLEVTEAALRETQARHAVAIGAAPALSPQPPLPPDRFEKLTAFLAGDLETNPFHQAYRRAKGALRDDLGVAPVTVPGQRRPDGVTRTAASRAGVT